MFTGEHLPSTVVSSRPRLRRNAVSFFRQRRERYTAHTLARACLHRYRLAGLTKNDVKKKKKSHLVPLGIHKSITHIRTRVLDTYFDFWRGRGREGTWVAVYSFCDLSSRFGFSNCNNAAVVVRHWRFTVLGLHAIMPVTRIGLYRLSIFNIGI